MLRTSVALGLALLVLVAVVPVVAQEGGAAPPAEGKAMKDCPNCKAIMEKGEGWCTTCNKGMMYGCELASKKLYDTLAGESADAAKITCPTCKTAMGSNGVCETCKVGFTSGKMYKAMCSYKLAMGKPSTAEQAAHCPGCKAGYEKNGYCSGCDMGYVAHRGFQGKDSYDGAVKAHSVIAKACKTKCEGCAVAMVTDGTCEQCKMTYKNGEVVK